MKSRFLKQSFPENIAYGSEVTIEYKTNVAESASGYEVRNINWVTPRRRYNISYGVKTTEQLKDLLNFFNNAKGRAHTFRFKDFTDYKIKDQPAKMLSPGIFQIMKGERAITKPVEGTVKAMSGMRNVDAFIDHDQGIMRMSLRHKEVRVSCEFDVPVRFDSDELSVTNVTDTAFDIGNIYLVEVRE